MELEGRDLEGRPRGRPVAQGARSSCAVMAVTVDLPLVPVMAM
jgi:hypothetical protein